MAWQQLVARLTADDLPQLEALLQLSAAEAWSLDDDANAPVLEPAPGETPLWPRLRLRALFTTDIDLERIATLIAESIAGIASIDIETLEDCDWERAGVQNIKPRKIGRRLWLTAADVDDESHGPCHMRLHMGLAFGTGEHPTTALCLEWLEQHLPQRSSILDYGCGSGILAIAALKLGASRAWATDNDPQALAATLGNGQLNGFSTERLWVGNTNELPRISVDIIAANILARPLEAMVSRFSDWLAPGGRIVLSGVLQAQSASVTSAYSPYFDAFDSAIRDDWVCLTAQRKAKR